MFRREMKQKKKSIFLILLSHSFPWGKTCSGNKKDTKTMFDTPAVCTCNFMKSNTPPWVAFTFF